MDIVCMNVRWTCVASWVSDEKNIEQFCSSNGKCLTSMAHELRKMNMDIHDTLPSNVTTTYELIEYSYDVVSALKRLIKCPSSYRYIFFLSNETKILTIGHCLEVKTKTFTGELETKSKTLRRGLEIVSKIVIERHRERQKFQVEQRTNCGFKAKRNVLKTSNVRQPETNPRLRINSQCKVFALAATV